MTTPLRHVADEITTALGQIDPTQVVAAATLIRATTGAILCTGQGRSGHVAAMTAMRLMHLGMHTHVVGEATAPAITSDDLLLVISGSGTNPVSVHYARIAARIGARILLTTRNRDSEVHALATSTIAVPAADTRQPGGNLFEQCALLVLDTVGSTIAAIVPDAAALLRTRHTNLQ